MTRLTKPAVCILSLLLASPAIPAQFSFSAVGLKIVVLQGEGAVNDLKTHIVTEPVVEVRDERDLPVAGAEVVFQLPSSGPGGVFPDHTKTYKTRSNAQGQAGAPAMIEDPQSGHFIIKVTATKDTQTASIAISQQNSMEMVARTRHKSGRWKIIAAAVGAAALGTSLYLLLHGHSTNSISAAPGPITVGGPQ